MEKKLGWKMEKYMKLMIFSLKLFNSLLYMSCSLSGNTLSSSSSLVIQPSVSNGITFKSTTGPVDYISNKNNLIIESGGTISLNILSNNYTTTTTYGSFSGDANGDLYIQAGTGSNVYIENNLTVGSGGGGGGTITAGTITTNNTASWGQGLNIINQNEIKQFFC